jgi:hypothetical protein
MIGNHYVIRMRVRERLRSIAALQAKFFRVPILSLSVVALAIQMMVVQVHIHVPQAEKFLGAGAISFLVGNADTATDQPSGSPVDKYPLKEDPASCPLCQAFAHSGQFVHSAAVLVALPFSVTVNFIVFREAVVSQFSVSHNWQGRAPPQA